MGNLGQALREELNCESVFIGCCHLDHYGRCPALITDSDQKSEG